MREEQPHKMGKVEQQSGTVSEVKQRRERLPTTAGMQDDCMDAGGRATQGAVAEVEQRRERLPTTAGMQEVEQRRERLPRRLKSRASNGAGTIAAGRLEETIVVQPSIKMIRYRLDVGSKHRVTSEELKKILIEESGVDKNNINNINIQGEYTLVELPDEMPQDIFLHLKSVEIKQRKLDIKRVKARNKKRNNYNRRGRHRSPGPSNDSDQAGA